MLGSGKNAVMHFVAATCGRHDGGMGDNEANLTRLEAGRGQEEEINYFCPVLNIRGRNE